MVAVVAGNGLGLLNASNNILGLSAGLGQDVLGHAANRGYVNAATGNVVLQMQDEVLSGRGFDLLQLRTYNSLGTLTDVLGAGTGWTLDAERSVAFDERTGSAGSSGTVRRTTGDGGTQTFTWNAALGLYASDDGAGAQDTLTYDKSQHLWTYTDGDLREVEVYGDSTANGMKGKLLTQTDVSGNVVSYAYDTATGRLASIVDGAANGSSGSQQKLQFAYDSVTGRLTSVNLVQLNVDANGRATGSLGAPLANVTDHYYGDGRLRSVTTDLTPNDTTDNNDTTKLYTTRYTYVSDPGLNSSLIASVTQSDGTSVVFSYYTSGANLGKVQSVTTGSGAAASVQSFSYGAGSTTITDGNGQVWTYKYDGQQRLIEIDAPSPAAGQTAPVTTYQYDPRGNLTQVTLTVDGNPAHNRVIRYEYDARDNRTLERDSLGNTVARAYDAKNQIVTETRYTGVDSNGLDPNDTGTMGGRALVTHYIYDAQEGLRFIVSPEGRVTENRYESGSYGQVTRTVVYAGGRFDPTTLNATGQEAQLATWASAQDQTQAQLTQYTYDLRGNLASKTAYANVSAAGVGTLDANASVLQYVYDGHGALLQTIAMRGASRDQRAVLSTIAYDGLGREVVRADSSGTTSTMYDDAHGAVQITNGANLFEVRTFDSAGRLISVAQRDAASGSTTPGRRTEYLYDGAGNLRIVQAIAADASVGSRSFSFYDADGRLQYAIDATGAVTGFVYDASGQLISQTAYANKVVTDSWTIGTPFSGAAIVPSASDDRTTAYTYDGAGRRVTTTDAEGTVTTTSYDGNSRVTSVQVGTPAAGYRTTQFFYDQDGKQVGVLDPLGFLTERKYDAAGRVTETVRYTNRAQGSVDVSTPVWNGVANQAASIGRLFVYHLPAAYDADGDAIQYSVVGALPSWLTFDPATLTLSGVPPQGTTGADITLKAADGTSGTARFMTANVHVTIVNAAPDWTNLPDATVDVNTTGFQIVLPDATDFETPAAQLVYSMTNVPPGMSFNAAGKTLNGTPNTAGTYIIAATVTDAGGLSTTRTFTLIVTNKGPSWTPDLSALPHAFRQQAFSFLVPTASDPEGQTLSYSLVSGPSWLTLPNSSSPRITGTPPVSAPSGSTSVVLEATDASGAKVRLAFSITIEGSPPTWSATLDYSTPAGSAIDYTPPAASDPDGGSIRYDLEGALPSVLSGLTIDHVTGRLTMGATSPTAVGNYSVVVRATDPEGKFIEKTVTIRLADTAPVYVGSLQADYIDWNKNPKTVLIPYSFFSDINGPFTLSVDGATPGEMPFNGLATDPWTPGFYFEPNYMNPNTVPIHGALDDPRSTDPGTRPIGVVTWYDPNAAVGTKKTVVVRATDAQGLSVTKSFTITVTSQSEFPPGPPAPPPHFPPPPPPHPPGGPPTSTPFAPTGPTSSAAARPIAAAPVPVLGELQPSTPAIAPAPAPKATLAPLVDALASIRPSDATGLHTYFYYDGQGRVIGTVDEKGFVTANVYNDAQNSQQVVKYANPVNVGSTDTLATIKSRAGATEATATTFDDRGRVLTTTAVDGTVTRYEYDAAGRVSRVVAADGTSNTRETRTRYDVYGDVTGVVSGVGAATLSAAATQAQIDAAIAGYGKQTQYDSLGRAIRTTDANGHNTYFFYDTDNRLTHTVDAAGEVSETLYNAFGQVSSVNRYAAKLTPAQLAMLTGGSKAGVTGLLTASATGDQLASYAYDRRGLLLTTTAPLSGMTTNAYTAFGELASQIRTILKGNNGSAGVTVTAKYAYDLDGRLLLETGDFGGLNYNSQLTYDSYGRVIRSVDGAGNAVTTSYRDSSGQDTGRTIQVTDPLNRTVRDDYDAFGRVLAHTDANGKVTTYSYDDTARTTTVTTPESISVTTTRNVFGEVVSVRDGRGGTTTYTYDKDGHVKTVTDPSGKITRNDYDASGRLAQTTDARGTIATLTYDAVDRVLTRTVDPSGLNLRTQYFYDAFGQVFQVVEGTRTTSYKHDQEGRLTQVIVDPSGLKLSTAYAYDGLGNVTRLDQGGGTTPSQQVTLYVFDKLGRRIKEIAAPRSATSIGPGASTNRDLTTEYRYDSAGRVSRSIDANGQSTWYVYDAAGELRYTIDALGEVRESLYDANGRVSQTRQYATRLSAATLATFGDAIGSFSPPATSTGDARTYLAYDNDGRLRYTVQALVGDGAGQWAVTENLYDANGNVIETRQYDRTLSNARIAANDTAGSAGLSVSEVSAELVTLGYTSDAALANVDRTRYAYDADNRLRFAVDALGYVSERVYDEAGNVVKTASYAAAPALTTYTESAIGAAVNRSNPDNRVTQFAYDKAGRLVYTVRVLSVDGSGNATGQLITKQSYDSIGNVTQVRQYAHSFGALGDYWKATLDNAVTAWESDASNRTTAFAYDAAGRQVYTVRVLAVDGAGAATLALVSKTAYDGVGHVVQTTQFGAPIGPLSDYKLTTLDAAVGAPAVAANAQNRTEAFVYDAAGRLVYDIHVLATDGTGKATQQLVTRRTYDALGNVVKSTSFASVMALADYQLSTVDQAVAANVTNLDRVSYFAYDAAGRRVYTVDVVDIDGNGKENVRITRAIYDAFGRLSQSIAYGGKLLVSDVRAQALDATTSSANVANNPANRKSAYVYDAAGRQVYSLTAASIDTNGNVTQQAVSKTIYDALGRVVQTVDYADTLAPADYLATTLDAAVAAVAGNPLNRVSAFAYDAAGNQIYGARLASPASGGTPAQYVVVRQSFDAFGDATQTKSYASTVALADFQRATFDAAVVPATIANDVRNRVSSSAYDALGRQVYTAQVSAVDGSGNPTQNIVTKRTYDAFDQVVQSTAYATPMALTSYTLATLDAAVAGHTSNQDRTTRFVYDAIGEQRFVIAADNSLTEWVYDTLGQVTEYRWFGATFTYDPAQTLTVTYLAGLRGGAHVGDSTTRGEKYTYDAAGRRLTTTDAGNYTETSTYDGVGNRTALADKNGGVWTYGYDALGRLRTQRSPSVTVRLSNNSTFTGSLQTTTDYDVFGDVTARTDAANTVDARTTSYTYDNLGRVLAITQPGWYDPTTGKVSGSNTAGSFQRTTENTYDAFGDAVHIKTRTGVSTYADQYQAYDALGHLAYQVDALNNVTGYTYDSFNGLTVLTRYSVSVPATDAYWTPAALASQLAGDTQARTLTTSYDLLGRKHQVTGQGTPAPTTTYEYDVFGELAHERQQVTESSARDTWHYYDVMGRETLTVDPASYQTVRTYDACGNLTKIVESAQPGGAASLTAPPALLPHDANDRITVFGYDTRNEQTSVSRGNFRYTNASGGDVDNGYDALTIVSTTAYDGLGRATAQTDALGNVTSIQYNALGQVTKVTEPARAIAGGTDPFIGQKSATPVTTYTLNAFGEAVSQSRVSIDANNGAALGSAITTSKSYDAAGNVISTTDGNGNVTNYQVDYAGRVVKQTVAINATLGAYGTVSQTIERRFAYDAAGRQTDVLEVYTDATAISQQTGTHEEFNAFGEVKADYREWGASGAAISGLTRAIVASYTYDRNGQRISKTAGDGITKYYYDLAGEVTRQEQYALALNPDGSVKIGGDGSASIDTNIAARVTETGYDALGRVTSVRLPAYGAIPAGASSRTLVTPVVLQAYDRWGNVVMRTQGAYLPGATDVSEARIWKYRYNANNQVIAATQPTAAAKRADGSTYNASVTHESHYDIAGRLIVERDVADDANTGAVETNVLRVRRHGYDAVGELTADVDGTNVRTEYAYDGNGNRVGTRNVGNGAASDAIVNTVFVDGYDANGNKTSHAVLRASGGVNPYVSGSGQTPVLFVLQTFQYDQANRRVASSDVMHDAQSNVYTSYTKYDERGLALEQHNQSGILTRFAYDQFGNRLSQLDANGNGQRWAYSSDTANYTAGQLRQTVAGSRTTQYGYDGFAEIASETYTDSSGALTAGQTNRRTYSYFENGLLQEVADVASFGAKGPDGGADYWKTVNASDYEYSLNGEQVRVSFTSNSEQDSVSYDDLGNVIGVDPNPIVNPAIARVTTMTYDALGRLATVSAPPAQNASRGTISALNYSYDELGNRREIDAVYQRITDGGAQHYQKWYAYDAEGRLTIVDGELVDGKIDANVAGAVEVSYDALGRRYITNAYVGDNSSDNGVHPGEVREIAAWTEFDAQKYTYNDLGYLTKTWQAITRRDITITDIRIPVSGPIPLGTTRHDDPHTGAWFLLEDRSNTDVRGEVKTDDVYSKVLASDVDYDTDFAPFKASHAITNYLADGRIDTTASNQTDRNGNFTHTSSVAYHYDATTGLVDNYTTNETFAGQPALFSTYKYTYSLESGGYKVKQIRVTAVATDGPAPQAGVTTNQYDSRGNLIGQTVTNPGQSRSYALSYDNNGQIISKTELLRVGNGAPTFGNQDFYYVNGHQVAVLGTDLLDTVQFTNDFAPVTTLPATQPGTYVVNAGDTLESIAQSLYGDARLWYLIADANSLGFAPAQPLPTTEVGRTYRIPTAVSEHNDASTFSPYDPSKILGSSSPSPYLPGQTANCADYVGTGIAVALVAAASIAVSIYTAGALSGVVGPVLANVIGGVAASAAGQSVAIGAGLQKDFSTDQLLQAGVGGFVGGFVGAAEAGIAGSNSALAGVFDNSYFGLAQGALLGQLSSSLNGNGITTQGVENSLFSLAVRFGANALSGGSNSGLAAALQGVVGGAASAANPFQDRPFSWANLATQALSGTVSVLLGNALSRRPREIAGPVESDGDRIVDRDESLIQEYGLSPEEAAGVARGVIADLSQPTVDQDIARLQGEVAEAKTSIGTEYTSQKADRTLEDVAERFYGKDYRWLATALAKASGINPLSFRPGMRVVVPSLDDIDLDAARTLRTQSNADELQAKNDRLDREWDAHASASAARYAEQQRQQAADIAAVGGPSEPLPEQVLGDIGTRLAEPAVQTALANPDFGKSVPVSKIVIRDGISYGIDGTHLIGSQPELDAEFSADASIVDIANHETASDIARRTGQADYQTFDEYSRKNPQLSGDALNDAYRNYHRAADAETTGAWDAYSRNFRIGTAIAQYTLETPLIVASPGSFVGGELVNAYGHEAGRWAATQLGLDDSWGDTAADTVQLGLFAYGTGKLALAAGKAAIGTLNDGQRVEQLAANTVNRTEGRTVSGEFIARDLANPAVEPGGVDATRAYLDNAVATSRQRLYAESGGTIFDSKAWQAVPVTLDEFHTIPQAVQGGCGFGAKSVVTSLDGDGFPSEGIFLNQNEDIFGAGVGRHAYTTVQGPNSAFIVDTTVAQFPEIPGNPLWNATRADLIQNGYTELNDAVANAYARGVSYRPLSQAAKAADLTQARFQHSLWPDLDIRWQ